MLQSAVAAIRICVMVGSAIPAKVLTTGRWKSALLVPVPVPVPVPVHMPMAEEVVVAVAVAVMS
jgi:hypothetical protein